jgi:hypothetical protein
MNFGYKTSFKTIDKGNIEIFGPFGTSAVISVYSEILTFLSSGFVFHYSFLIMLSIVLIIFNYVFILSFAINSMVFLCLFFAYLAFISKIA